jgi:hypothetical protein
MLDGEEDGHYQFVIRHRWSRCPFAGMSTSSFFPGETSGTSGGSVWNTSSPGRGLDRWLLETQQRRVDLDSWPLGETPKTSCGLGPWELGTKKRGLGLAPRTLGIPLE